MFRLCVLAFRCLHGILAPQYLAKTLHLTTSRSSCSRLCSAATSTLIVPAMRWQTLGDRAFPAAAAHAWNSVPSFVRDEQSLVAFRQQLKTVLFRTSFGEDANTWAASLLTRDCLMFVRWYYYCYCYCYCYYYYYKRRCLGWHYQSQNVAGSVTA